MPQLPPVTKALMLICTAIFCVQSLLRGWLEYLFALHPIGSGAFYPWQVITYAFLHGGMGHLFFNMLGLWMFGAEMEQIWGRKRYMQFLAAGALAGAVLQMLIGLVAPVGMTLGASGSIYALLLGYAMMFPDRIIMPLFPPIPMKAKYAVIVFGVMALFLGMTGGGGIAHFAHLGGMLGGWLMLRFWRGQAPFSRRRF